MMQKVAIVTTKQPGTNPRMRKNADALSAAGHDVIVLYAFNALWADASDKEVFHHSQWRHSRIGGHPIENPWRYTIQRVRRKWASWTRDLCASFNPCIKDYIKKLEEIQPNIVIGHNPGALPVLTAWRHHCPVLFDAEDDHPGEFKLNSLESQRVAKLEAKELKNLNTITAASPLIGAEYSRRFPHLRITTVDNCFDARLQPSFQDLVDESLKFVWFSQVVGLDRGLQGFLQALSPATSVKINLTIIGLATEEVRQTLKNSLISKNHILTFKPPVSERKLLVELGQHHIGLAIETGMTRNRKLCRTNKLFCYPLAGCLTLASDTPSQRQFMDEHPEAGTIFSSTDQLLRLVRKWANNPSDLCRQRKIAWNLGHTTLNWEKESSKLLGLVDSMIEGAS